MARLADLPFRYRLFMKTYRLRKAEWAVAELPAPLARARLAVVTTAGLYLPGQQPFDEGMKGGDFTFREIPLDADLSTTRVGHRSAAFDSRGVEQDPQLALPFELLGQLVTEGSLGSLSQRHFSFQGSITAVRRLQKVSGPRLVQALLEDRVQAVLLTTV